MTRHLLCAMAALSCASPAFGASTAPPAFRTGSTTISIAMTSGCAPGDTVMTIARSEAARVWSRADVGVRWTTVAELPYASQRSEWLVVRCTPVDPAPAPREAPGVVPIAAIRFIGAQPTNTILVNLANAEALLRHDARESRDLYRRFAFVMERRLGRMIGRAIAHEIGHFLSESGAHTPSGLMKARHSVAAFTGESLSPFKIDRADFAQYVDDARRRARLDLAHLLSAESETLAPIR